MDRFETEVLRHLRYMLIEDNAGDASLIKKNLAAALGELSDFTHVENLSDAIRLAQVALPDIIFLDMILPDVDSDNYLGGLAQLVEIFPMVDIILISGSPDLHLPLRALETGAKDFLNKKEIRKDNLVRVVQFCVHRSQMSKDLVNAGVRVEQAQLAQGRFVANMSHEMRTPLNAILGYTEMMVDDLGQSEVNALQMKEFLEEVHRSGKNLLSMISELLELSRLEANQCQLAEEEFNLDVLLDDVDRDFALRSALHPVTFRRLSVFPESIYGDVQKIRQVLMHLVGNALKFSDQKPVEVDCWLEEGTAQGNFLLRIDVQDRGPGLTKSEQQKVFNAFTQLDGSATRSYGGTGMGLYLVDNFCRLMNGMVWVSSEVGVGSTFHVKIPVSRNGCCRKPTFLESKTIVDEILILDRDESAKILLAKQCEYLGYQVVVLQGWQDALDRMDRGNRQLYLLSADSFSESFAQGVQQLRWQIEQMSCQRNTFIQGLVLDLPCDLFAWSVQNSLDGVICKSLNLNELSNYLKSFFAGNLQKKANEVSL